MSSTDPFSEIGEPGRRLTESEIKFLQPIFRDTLPYSRILCYTMAGPRSITPTGNPYFARSIYFDDFSKIPSGDPKRINSQWNFVHELTHVWQYYHGINLVGCAIKIAFTEKYEQSYEYFLQPHKSFLSYNIERQASIVADYWIMLNKYLPLYNHDKHNARISDYAEAMKTVQGSGLPRMPILPTAPEFPNSDAN
jgi:hypothetical protein